MRTALSRLARPWIIMPLLAIVGVGVWWLVARSGTSTSNATPQTATVTRGSMARTISASGTVAAAQTDDLSFASGGTVTAVNVAAGDTVTTGQVLATIDSSSLQASAATAEANLASAQAQLSDDTSQGASADKITADNSSVTTAQDALDQANANLAGARLVATFNGTVTSVDLTVGEQLGSQGAGATTMTGTGSGSGQTANDLGSSSSDSGFGGRGSGASTTGTSTPTSSASTTSSTGSPQIQVISTGRYTVTLGVSSADVGNLEVGQSATVALSSATATDTRRAQFLAAFGGFGGGAQNAGQTNTTPPSSISGTQATGTVTSVGAVANATSGVATFPVVVTFTGSPSTFQPGATVNSTITYAEVPDAIQVPTRAVTTDDSGSTVDVVAGSSHRSVTVTVGQSINGMTQITSGLRSGEKVIVPSFSPGARGGSTDGTTRTGGFQGRGGQSGTGGFRDRGGFGGATGATP